MPEESEDSAPQAMPSGNVAVPAGGYKPMRAKPNSEKYAPVNEVAHAKLPPKVDLRRFMTPVEDQGQTSSCVAHAVAGAYEYGVKRVTKQNTDVSRLFVYYNARWRDEDQDNDDGCIIQYAMEGLQRFGACPEKTWPFKKPMLLTKPNRSSYQQGLKGKVSELKQVPVNLKAWKQCLAEGHPIVFGTVLFDSFDECTENAGIVPMPDPKEIKRATHGGHSMLCVGYSDVEKVFIVRNSWGKDFGDQGYCYMPYDYLMNPKFNDGDCWIFTPPTNLNDPPAPPSPHQPPQPHRPHRPDRSGYQDPYPVVFVPLPIPMEFWFWDDTPVVDPVFWSTYEMVTYTFEEYEVIEFDFFEEYTVEWSEVVAEEYMEYSEWSYEERFESMEEYSVEEVTEEYTSQTSSSSASSSSSFSLGTAATAMAAVAAGTAGLAAAGVFDGKDDQTSLAEVGDSLTTENEEADSEEADDEEADDDDAEEEDAEEEEDSDDAEDEESAEEEEASEDEESEDDSKESDDEEDEESEDDSEEDDEESEDDAEEEAEDDAEDADGDEESEDDEDSEDESEESEDEDEEDSSEEEDDSEESDDEGESEDESEEKDED